jgi:hypothetical protein
MPVVLLSVYLMALFAVAAPATTSVPPPSPKVDGGKNLKIVTPAQPRRDNRGGGGGGDDTPRGAGRSVLPAARV